MTEIAQLLIATFYEPFMYVSAVIAGAHLAATIIDMIVDRFSPSEIQQ